MSFEDMFWKLLFANNQKMFKLNQINNTIHRNTNYMARAIYDIRKERSRLLEKTKDQRKYKLDIAMDICSNQDRCKANRIQIKPDMSSPDWWNPECNHVRKITKTVYTPTIKHPIDGFGHEIHENNIWMQHCTTTMDNEHTIINNACGFEALYEHDICNDEQPIPYLCRENQVTHNIKCHFDRIQNMTYNNGIEIYNIRKIHEFICGGINKQNMMATIILDTKTMKADIIRTVKIKNNEKYARIDVHNGIYIMNATELECLINCKNKLPYILAYTDDINRHNNDDIYIEHDSQIESPTATSSNVNKYTLKTNKTNGKILNPSIDSSDNMTYSQMKCKNIFEDNKAMSNCVSIYGFTEVEGSSNLYDIDNMIKNQRKYYGISPEDDIIGTSEEISKIKLNEKKNDEIILDFYGINMNETVTENTIINTDRNEIITKHVYTRRDGDELTYTNNCAQCKSIMQKPINESTKKRRLSKCVYCIHTRRKTKLDIKHCSKLMHKNHIKMKQHGDGVSNIHHITESINDFMDAWSPPPGMVNMNDLKYTDDTTMPGWH